MGLKPDMDAVWATLPGFVVEKIFEVEQEECARSLATFVKKAWAVIEPGAKYYDNWHIGFICTHLESIARGDTVDGRVYNRLLVNVPPGMMKSLLVSVFFPAWVWGPFGAPQTRFLCVSHNIDLAIRDNLRMRRLIQSEWYQSMWGGTVKLTADQSEKKKFENTATGFRQACSTAGVTGNRADILIIDDPHSVASAGSEAERKTETDSFLEAIPTRLNKPESSAIVMIMQRLHEEDCSGIVLEHKGGLPGWDHIMLPMRFDPDRAHPTMLGKEDRRTEAGELLFPERFPSRVVDELERTLGSFATAGQHQQTPVPRGGGIIKDDWWTLWEPDQDPPLDFVCAWLDTAYTEKEENDPSAMIVWGVFQADAKASYSPQRTRDGKWQEIERVYAEGSPNLVMMYAWAERLSFPDLCKKVVSTAKKWKIDRLLIEDKAAGISVSQELRRSFGIEDFGVELVKTSAAVRAGGGGDKRARLYAVQHVFEEGMVWAPDKVWAEKVIREVSTFPKGKHDDLVDCVSGGVGWLRSRGFLQRAPERLDEMEQDKRRWGKAAHTAPLYPS